LADGTLNRCDAGLTGSAASRYDIVDLTASGNEGQYVGGANQATGASAMIVRTLQEVDLVYGLVLGRMPENNFVREGNIGRPVTDLAKAAIESEQFERSVVERFLQHGLLPHRTLSVRLSPDVLRLIAEAQLHPAQRGPVRWRMAGVSGRVLSAAPCRPMVAARYEATQVDRREQWQQLTGYPPRAAALLTIG
jgi:hypothetical protein